MPKKEIPENAQSTSMLYSPVVKIGNHFHFSGIIPDLDKGTTMITKSFIDQTNEVLNKMKKALKDCGLSFNDIFHVTVLLSGSMENFPQMNESYALAMNEVEIKPARKACAVAGLPFGALIEIEFEAVKQD